MWIGIKKTKIHSAEFWCVASLPDNGHAFSDDIQRKADNKNACFFERISFFAITLSPAFPESKT